MTTNTDPARSENKLRTYLAKHYSVPFIMLAPCVLLVPMIIKGEALFWGTPLLQFVPWREFARDVIADGYLPLWNPLLGFGAPLIANYQSALFYPPNAVLFLVGPAWGQGLLVLAHLIWAGLGMRNLVKELGLGEFAQTVAGLSFSLSGYMVARSGFLTINAAAAWLPWIILMVERLVKRRSTSSSIRSDIRSIILLSLALALQWLAGHAQTSWYSLILAVAWMIWRSNSLGRLRGIVRSSLGFILSGILAFLISAVQLLPVLEYLLQSQRASELEVEFAFTYSFWPWRLLGLLMPNLFGNPAHGDFWGYANFWEDAIYIGVLPVFLAGLYLFRKILDKKGGSFARFLFFVGLCTFLLALGKNTPLFPFLFEHIPTFDLFQAPARWSILLVFSLSLLAALGVEEWEKGELIRLFWVRLGTVGAVAITVIAMLSSIVLPDIKASFIPAVAMFGIWTSLLGFLAWQKRLRPNPFWPIIGCLLVSIDLIWAGSGLSPTVDLAVYQGQSALPGKVSAIHRLYMDSEMEYALKYEETHRFDTFNPGIDWRSVRDVGLPNTTMLDSLASINNFDPILTDRYVSWLQGVEALSRQLRDKWFRFVDVGWVADWDSSGIESVTYLELPDPRRAHLIGEVNWIEDGDQVLETIFRDDFDPFKTVVLEPDGQIVNRNWGSDGKITIVEQADPNLVQLVIEAHSDTMLVLSDQWFPGWRAYLDGMETKIFRADYLFRAIPVPPGSHTVEFKYRPSSFSLGATLSGLGLIAFGMLLWKTRKP